MLILKQMVNTISTHLACCPCTSNASGLIKTNGKVKNPERTASTDRRLRSLIGNADKHSQFIWPCFLKYQTFFLKHGDTMTHELTV